MTGDHLRISPTQIEVIERCERLWFYDRVLKLRDRTPSKSQTRGMLVEDIIAAALFKGETPPAGKDGAIAKAMLKFLPSPGTPGMISQQEFEVPLDVDGVVVILNGKKDLVIPGVKVWDFKTTKSLSRWQKTPAQLTADIQSQVYAFDEWVTHGLDPVPLDWVYGQTEGAQKADHTSIHMPAATFTKGRDRAISAARKILKLRANKPAVETIPANTSACDMFGGCAHRAYCPARASRLADFLPKGEGNMGFKDKLRASLGIESSLDLAPSESATGDQIIAPVPLGTNGRPIVVADEQKRCIACEGTGWNTKGGPCKICEGDGTKRLPAEKTVDIGAQDSAPPAQGINPPDALPSPDDIPKEPEAPKSEKPRRGRKPRVEGEPNRTEELATPVNSTEATTGIRTLLIIDGAVLKGLGTPLEPLLRSAAVLAAQKAEVDDWRFVEYGKGAGLLLVSFAELWEKTPPSGLLTLSSRAPEAAAVMAWLIDRVDLVIKGV